MNYCSQAGKVQLSIPILNPCIFLGLGWVFYHPPQDSTWGLSRIIASILRNCRWGFCITTSPGTRMPNLLSLRMIWLIFYWVRERLLNWLGHVFCVSKTRGVFLIQSLPLPSEHRQPAITGSFQGWQLLLTARTCWGTEWRSWIALGPEWKLFHMVPLKPPGLGPPLISGCAHLEARIWPWRGHVPWFQL